ncbi:GNAT family N-acetyltransferase [Bradyrhizobium sp.]|uniref:GNAT family N-acetyltransferase n=1 Tax=Bradyrhizobium sp. TaxID=376 RepID=UPI002E00DEF8|nr:GNAT family N-acetyltransferase [Bradyrhizobium sp.]
MNLSAPALLADHHQLETFNSGVPPLDEWLRRRARANQVSGASRSFVICADDIVVGYYALASGAVNAAVAPSRFRRNMPDPIPVAVLGRLAIDQSCHGQGIGRALFRDSALRVMQAAEAIGIRGMLVHAISDEAKAFYLALGLSESPLEPMTLMVTLADLQATL